MDSLSLYFFKRISVLIVRYFLPVSLTLWSIDLILISLQVIVEVVNQLPSQVITIHWHGLLMRDNNWMDGTAYVTQYPIYPMQKFTYQLIADPPGTHWYHSHMPYQRSDGLYGAFIVHQSLPSLPQHVLLVFNYIKSFHR